MVANQFRGFNLFIDGTSYYGKVKGVELPTLTTEQNDRVHVSSIGTQQMPKLLEAMEATITTSEYSAPLTTIGADNQTTRVFQLLGDIGEFGAPGTTPSKQVEIILQGRVIEFTPGEMNSEDEIEMELMITVDAYKHVYDGNVLHDIAIDPPRHIVNGVNLIETRNRNLGI